VHVHQNDVRLNSNYRFDSAGTIGRFADDLEVRLDAEAEPKTRADKGLVINKEESDWSCHGRIIDVRGAHRIGRAGGYGGAFAVTIASPKRGNSPMARG
jgi:hypothetical protein